MPGIANVRLDADGVHVQRPRKVKEFATGCTDVQYVRHAAGWQLGAKPVKPFYCQTSGSQHVPSTGAFTLLVLFSVLVLVPMRKNFLGRQRVDSTQTTSRTADNGKRLARLSIFVGDGAHIVIVASRTSAMCAHKKSHMQFP